MIMSTIQEKPRPTSLPTNADGYYNYAKISLDADGSKEDVYYQIGSSSDVLKPSTSAGEGHDWVITADSSVISNGKISGSGSVTIKKVPQEYSVSVGGQPQSGKVTYGTAWSSTSYAPQGNTGYMLSSSVSGNGPYNEVDLLGGTNNQTVGVPANGSSFELVEVSKVTVDSAYSQYIKGGWYKADGTITLPNNVIDLGSGKAITGWKVGNNPEYKPGATINVSDIVSAGGKIEPVIKKAYSITIDGKGTVTVYEGDEWSSVLNDLSVNGVRYQIDGNSNYINAADTIKGISDNITVKKEICVTYNTPAGASSLIEHNQIGNTEATTVSSSAVWVRYNTQASAIKDFPIAKYEGGSGTQFVSWDYGSTTEITEPITVSTAIMSTIEAGVDIANPNYLYINYEGTKYVFWLGTNYISKTEFESSNPNGFLPLDTKTAGIMLSLPQDDQDRLAGWIFYWDTEYLKDNINRLGNTKTASSISWVKGGINGHNSIEIPHYMKLDDTDFGLNGSAMDYEDVVDYIKEYKQFPGVGVMWANNSKDRVKITTFDATEDYDVSGIYYKTV